MTPELAKIIARLTTTLKPGQKRELNLQQGVYEVTRMPDGGLQAIRQGDYRPPNQGGGAVVAPDPKIWGPQRWEELHVWALQLPTAKDRLSFVATFSSRIPCGECKRHWKEVLEKRPPQTASADEFFAWSVEAHNDVNEILEKPRMELAEARPLWTERAKAHEEAPKLEQKPDRPLARRPLARRTSRTITVVHRIDPENIGDMLSSPMRYYRNDAQALDILTAPIDALRELSGNIILGGGALFGQFAHPYDWMERVRIVLSPAEHKRVAIWGAGLANLDDYPREIHQAKLIGIRDFGLALPFVPCASVLYNFPERAPTDDVGGFESWTEPLNLPFPTIDNKADAPAVMEFLSRFRVIVTNSYHGVLWATMMGRRVVLIPRESEAQKFARFRYRPIPATRKTWGKAIKQAVVHEGALSKSREVTRRFAEKVGLLFGRPLIPVSV